MIYTVKTMNRLIPKLDFEKPYDKVKWPFPSTCYVNERLLTEMACLGSTNNLRGHVGVKVTDEVGPFFTTHKGLRALTS